MNLKKILYGAALLTLAGACSDDIPVNNGNQQETKGEGYISVQVNLPQGTRADNDQFNDGDSNEYAVKDGCILIFKGEDQDKAAFLGAFSLNDADKDESLNNTDNLTATYLKVANVSNVKIEEGEDGIHLFGLVMLNYTGVGEIYGTDHKFKLRSTGAIVEKLADLTSDANVNDYLTNYIGANKDYFFMTNAPMSNKIGGISDPTGADLITLIQLDPSNIFESQADAVKAAKDDNKVVGEFFVERAVAKATLSSAVTELTMDAPLMNGVANSTVTTINKTEDGTPLITWTLGNTEDRSYIVRNIEGAEDIDGVKGWLGYKNDWKASGNQYRFVSAAAMGKTIYTNYDLEVPGSKTYTPVFRTYWCKDPHYADNKNTCDDAALTDADFVAPGAKAFYCFENTFNVAHQNHFNTTRAILKVVLNGGKDFYTVNDRQDIVYATDEDAMTFSKNYIIQSRAVYTAIWNALDKPTQEDVTNIINNAQDKIVIDYATDAEGYVKVTNISFLPLGGDNGTPAFEDENTLKDLKETVNELYKVAKYSNGVNYYSIWIKHFAGKDYEDANDLAPWDPAKLNIVTPTENTDNSYGWVNENEKAERNFLGRYGMVRNNWYDLNVTSISHFGKPTLTTLTVEKDGTPDDEYDDEKWLTFKINVLAWALRQQQVDL